MPPAERLADHLSDLFDVLDGAGLDEAELIGVSGGATLALLAGMTRPGRFRRIVAHEPLVGRVVPELHQAIADAADRLARATTGPPDLGVRRFVAELVGTETWDRIDATLRRELDRSASTVRTEVAQFASFDPSPDDLAALHDHPLVVTVGSRSSPARHRAADLLTSIAGATSVVLANCGHLAPLDAPERLGAAILGDLEAAPAATRTS